MNDPQDVDRLPVNRQGMARDIVWLAPIAAITLSATWVLVRMADGDRLATILALPLAVLAIVVGRMVARHVRATRPPRRVPRWGWAISAALTIVALMAAALLPGDPTPSPPSARDQGLTLSDIAEGKTVKIGYNGQIPGWSDVSSDLLEPTGFDARLGQYLAREFKWAEVRWVRVTQEQRMSYLQGPERGVDLVISNFSINASRLKEIDMAGPYYQDATSIAINDEKFSKQFLNRAITVCATSGSTSKAAADLLAKEGEGGLYDVMIEPQASLQGCESRLHATDGPSAVISDWSMLKAFGQHRVVSEPDSLADVSPEYQQLYGVGLPNDSTEVCRRISSKINDFLREDSSQPVSPWRTSFNDTLKPRGLDVSWHKPTAADHTYCDQ
jgi:ABC-type amino acid transport substrate-binding protein